MSEQNSKATAGPAAEVIARRLEKQRRRIYQAVGTVHTVMKVLNAKFDDAGEDDELTPLWSALLLATETLEDAAEQLEAPVVLKQIAWWSAMTDRQRLEALKAAGGAEGRASPAEAWDHWRYGFACEEACHG